jgi:hypothetical protein
MNVAGLLVRKLGIYLAAVLTTYLLATATASLHVAASLSAMGLVLSLAERASMILNDLAGMAGMFLPLIAFALLIAFLVTALVHRLLGRGQVLLYVLAGAVALLALHLALRAAFDLTPVAIARSSGGLLLQALAGAAGGIVYIGLNRRLGVRVFEPDVA